MTRLAPPVVCGHTVRRAPRETCPHPHPTLSQNESQLGVATFPLAVSPLVSPIGEVWSLPASLVDVDDDATRASFRRPPCGALTRLLIGSVVESATVGSPARAHLDV